MVDLAVLGLARGWENIFIFLKPTRTLLFPYSVRNTVFLGAFVLIVLFLMLGYVIYTVARRTRDHQGFLLVMGANFLIVGQAFANMAMVCGILPVIGVPLSFISYGGTSLVTTLLAMGLVFSVYHDEVRREEKEAPPTLPLAIHSGLPLWERRAIRKTGGKNEAFIFQFFPQKETKKGD